MGLWQWFVGSSPQLAAVSAVMTVVLLYWESPYAVVTSVVTGVFVSMPKAVYLWNVWAERRERARTSRQLGGGR